MRLAALSGARVVMVTRPQLARLVEPTCFFVEVSFEYECDFRGEPASNIGRVASFLNRGYRFGSLVMLAQGCTRMFRLVALPLEHGFVQHPICDLDLHATQNRKGSFGAMLRGCGMQRRGTGKVLLCPDVGSASPSVPINGGCRFAELVAAHRTPKPSTASGSGGGHDLDGCASLVPIMPGPPRRELRPN